MRVLEQHHNSAIDESRSGNNDRRGAILILVALMMVVLLITVVLSVDVALMQLTRTELRSATDAATRAGSEALSRTQETSEAISAAKAIAARNTVSLDPLLLADTDIIFGNSTRNSSGNMTFVEGMEPMNTVRVTGRRTNGSPSGAAPLFFGHIVGRSSFEPIYVASAMNLDRDLCLVVDRSGSMKRDLIGGGIPGGLGRCDPPHASLSRWGALNIAVQTFISSLESTEQEEQLGLVSYSSDHSECGINFNAADINQPLDFDYENTIDEMASISSIPINGFTNIEAGIVAGAEVLTDTSRARPLAQKTMVLLTDGIYNRGRHPRFAAEDAAAEGIIIHTITFSDAAEQTAMQEVAEAAGGQHFHAPDAAALQDIFREIALTLPIVMTQ